MNTCRVRITRSAFDELSSHLFPGDGDEHGAVMLAGVSTFSSDQTVLTVREVHHAAFGTDYVEGTYGYRALSPRFIHRLITRARDERLAYIAVHNHATKSSVRFSRIDLDSHERGYPALLQIARGMPVGAMVFGTDSAEIDLWMPDGTRHSLDRATIVGAGIRDIRPQPLPVATVVSDVFDRQVRLLGSEGQRRLAKSKVAIVGLGGIGSLVADYLSRLGVERFVLIDPDAVEASNLSRIAGSKPSDAKRRTLKVDVTTRLIRSVRRSATIAAFPADVANSTVARELCDCDYIFVAADSMRARLVCNAVVQQYLIPGVQLGSKIRATTDGQLLDILSANRPLRPGHGCLWCNQLIDPTELALEAKSDHERREQAYGVREPNPSVISLNAISAAHATNDFLLDFLCLREEPEDVYFEHFHPLSHRFMRVLPRRDPNCSECGSTGLRFARGDGVELPCSEG